MRKVHPVQQRSARWHELRKQSIGGSEVSVLFGLNDYKSPRDLWAIKAGLQEEEDLSDNDQVNRGVVFEEVALKVITDELESDGWFFLNSHTYVDPDSYMHHSSDGVFQRATAHGNERLLVELKVPSPYRIKSIIADGPDLSWVMQLQHGLHCCECQSGVLGVLDVSTGRVLRWEVSPSPTLVERMKLACRKFFVNFVEKDRIPYEFVPPKAISAVEVVGTSTDTAEEDANKDRIVEAPSGGSAAIYADLMEKKSEIDKEIKEAKARLETAFTLAGGVGTMLVGDGRKIKRFEGSRKGGIDVALAQAENPSVDWDRYQKPSSYYKSMRVSGKKGEV